MSISTEIQRLKSARNNIRTKLHELGLAGTTPKLDVLADVINKIENCGAVSAQVQEGSTYTIPRGYHNGAGTVSGVAGGGSYNLQSKSVTPTKSQQTVTPDDGYFGISDVVVAAIPDNYNDTSDVTAEASHVLANRIIVTADGETVAGTMADNGTISGYINGLSTLSYTIPAGYTAGGTVSLSGDIEISLAAI